jgi:hypothetical protein
VQFLLSFEYEFNPTQNKNVEDQIELLRGQGNGQRRDPRETLKLK